MWLIKLLIRNCCHCTLLYYADWRCRCRWSTWHSISTAQHSRAGHEVLLSLDYFEYRRYRYECLLGFQDPMNVNGILQPANKKWVNGKRRETAYNSAAQRAQPVANCSASVISWRGWRRKDKKDTTTGGQRTYNIRVDVDIRHRQLNWLLKVAGRWTGIWSKENAFGFVKGSDCNKVVPDYSCNYWLRYLAPTQRNSCHLSHSQIKF